MSRQYIPQNDAPLRERASELQAMRESDPEAYFKHIEDVRQRSYRLAGRNPDGSRK